jgi:uncharacterized membrane protein YeaQ/YmgE (transglycosylase-associated protein family)
MDILITIIVGGVVGWLASIVMKTNAQMGIIANIIVGIVGIWLGQWVAVKLGIASAGTIAWWLVGIGGAMLLILILKVLRVFR